MMVRSHLEGLLAVEQELNRHILQILHPGNLLEVTLGALEPEILGLLALELGLDIELLKNLGPDGYSGALKTLGQKLKEELAILVVVLIKLA